MDLISREAAIDAIEEYADRLQMVNWKENPNVPYKAHALNWCINTIRELPSAQQWIPCKERLPEYHKNVLLAGVEMLNNSIVYAVKQLDIDTWRPANYAPSVKWEAWMPIEPWRGEE